MIGLCLRDLMMDSNLCVKKTDPLIEAIKTMRNNEKGVVVVLDDTRCVGIVTERDVIRLIKEGIDLHQNTYKYATQNIISIEDSKSVTHALNLMIENNIRRLVVSDTNKRFRGVITQQDIIHFLEDDFYRSTIKLKHLIDHNKPIVSVTSSQPLSEAIELLFDKNISSLPVLEDNKPVGIITEKDIVRLITDGIGLDKAVGDFMSKPPIVLNYEEPITKAVSLMNMKNIRRVIVTDYEGKALTVITHRDLLNNLDSNYSEFIERKLKHTKDVLNHLPEIILEIYDKQEEQIVVWANKSAIDVFGENVINTPIYEIISKEKWLRIYENLCNSGTVKNVKFKKDDFVYEISGYFIRTEGDICVGKIQLVIRDITEEVKLYTSDPLTGLYNRRFISEYLHKEIELSKRYGKKLALAMLDIDNFKNVNDTYGHLIGDKVLKEISNVFIKTLRDSDIIGRYGGEEFVIVMPEIDKKSSLNALKRVLKNIEQNKIDVMKNGFINVTVSAGVSSYPEDADNVTDLFILSDERLYKAKRQGKNRVIDY
ncbi:MAG: diguanylate cyclase [Thermodesulfovibrionales bacterium]|nr:diguanylate cyclase [Thermodesulfovibrionales bacterium]